MYLFLYSYLIHSFPIINHLCIYPFLSPLFSSRSHAYFLHPSLPLFFINIFPSTFSCISSPLFLYSHIPSPNFYIPQSTSHSLSLSTLLFSHSFPLSPSLCSADLQFETASGDTRSTELQQNSSLSLTVKSSTILFISSSPYHS